MEWFLRLWMALSRKPQKALSLENVKSLTLEAGSYRFLLQEA